MELITKPKCLNLGWHKWFAWYPILIALYDDGAERWVWLTTVLRKLDNDGWDVYYTYKDLSEV